MRERVGVIGAGAWGTALARILADNRTPVLLWARRQEVCEAINRDRRNDQYLPAADLGSSLEATTDLHQICRQCELLLLAVPSRAARAVLRDMAPKLERSHVIVHGIKGFERDSLKRMSQVIAEETVVAKIGVLTGPNLALELAQRQPAGAVIAAQEMEVFKRFHAVLRNRYFRVYGGRDVVGAEIGGAFAGTVAVAAGVADGLRLGLGTKALLLTRGLTEEERLGQAMGAELITFSGMAGVGDMIACASSDLSRDYKLGRRLGAGEAADEVLADSDGVSESVDTCVAITRFADESSLDLPISRGVFQAVHERADVVSVLGQLLKLPTGSEFSGLEE